MTNNVQNTTALTSVLLQRTPSNSSLSSQDSLALSVSTASSNDSLIGTSIPTINIPNSPPRSHISRFIQRNTLNRNVNEKIR